MTHSLPRLLQKVHKSAKNSLIASLVRLFTKLTEKKVAARIEELKKNGPAEFAESHQQEDAHQYLLYLMSMLEIEFKGEGLLKDFQALYQIQSKSTIKCQVCGHQTENTQEDYCYTASNK